MDLVYVRFPPRLLLLAASERSAAECLASGTAPDTLLPGETIEDIDLVRSQDYLYTILGCMDDGRPVGPAYYDPLSPDDWVANALRGIHPLPLATNPHIYGYAHVLADDDVQRVATHLGAVTDAAFRGAYARCLATKGRLRPDLDSDPFEDHWFPQFASLRRFYAEAAEHHQAVLITPT